MSVILQLLSRWIQIYCNSASLPRLLVLILALVLPLALLACAAWLSSRQEPQDQKQQQQQPGAEHNPDSTPCTAVVPTSVRSMESDNAALRVMSRSEVARRCSPNSGSRPTPLLLIIDRSVYDLTEFVSQHPGGEEAIVRNAGRDATAGFHGMQHPSRAHEDLQLYRIAVLPPSP